MDPEKSNRPAFGVTSFPSSTPHQDINQSGPRQRVSFTFPPIQASRGFSRWASSSAGLLNASPSEGHPQEISVYPQGISVKKEPTTSDSNMELDAIEAAPHAATAGAASTPVVAVRGDQVQGDCLLASRAISPDRNGVSGDMSIVPVAADASRSCVVFEPKKDQEMCLPLASVNIPTLSRDKVMYYFGVLATRALLLPKFQCSSTKKGTWKCRLTLYGHTFECDYIFHTSLEAKGAMARKALEKLQSIYSAWTVPPEPMDCPLAKGWSWTEILKDYCIQNGLPEPTYTKYDHQHGCRHEAQVANFSRFAVLKHYAQELDSRNSAAQMTLYALLTFGQLPPDGITGAAALRNFDEGLLVTVPRETLQAVMSSGSNSSKCPRKRLLEDHTNKGQAKKRGVKSSSEIVNANLLPLAGKARLAPVEAHEEHVEKKWKVSYWKLESELKRGWETNTEKLQRICQLLSLELPEIRVGANDNQWLEGGYSAAAYFKNDPFLSRASPIGKSKGTMFEAEEACAQKVAKYLIDMVREDTRMEEEAAKESYRVRNWGSMPR